MRKIPLVLIGSIAASLAFNAMAPGTASAARRRVHYPVAPNHVPWGHRVRRVSLTVDRAPIRSVLSLLFRRGGASYVLGPGVAGTVTASLHNIPFQTALHQILTTDTVPLTYQVVHGIYVIKGRHATYRRVQPVYRRPVVVPHPVYPRPRIGYPARPFRVPATGGTVRVVP